MKKIEKEAKINKNSKLNKKSGNWIYSNFKISLEYLKESKNYILFAFLLFLVSVSFGLAFPSLFEKQVLKVVEELVKETQDLGTLELISFIIFNNMKSAFFGLIFGAVFGFIPFLITIVNGYVLGFFMKEFLFYGGCYPMVFLKFLLLLLALVLD